MPPPPPPPLPRPRRAPVKRYPSHLVCGDATVVAFVAVALTFLAATSSIIPADGVPGGPTFPHRQLGTELLPVRHLKRRLPQGRAPLEQPRPIDPTPPAFCEPHEKPRHKRQLQAQLEQGNAVVDNIFQIPISTLNAVGSLVKSIRPLVLRTRERIQQYYTNNGQSSNSQFQQQQQQQYPYINYPRPPSYIGGYPNNRRKPQRNDFAPQGRDFRQNDGNYV